MNEVDCEYKDRCSSYPLRCKFCKKNKGKQDYYEPSDWYEPRWIPTDPCVRPLKYPYIWF